MNAKSKVIAFESVYSMDDDFSPISEICKLAKKYRALTFLDEVHVLVFTVKEEQVLQKCKMS